MLLATTEISLLSDRLLSRNERIQIYKTMILPVVLYGCETWSLTLREEQRLRVSENKILRIFEPKRDEVIGGWRKMHNEGHHNLYSSKYYYNDQKKEDKMSRAWGR
jgi:hypothetical protein